MYGQIFLLYYVLIGEIYIPQFFFASTSDCIDNNIYGNI